MNGQVAKETELRETAAQLANIRREQFAAGAAGYVERSIVLDAAATTLLADFSRRQQRAIGTLFEQEWSRPMAYPNV